MPNTTPLLKASDVALLYNVHPETIRRWARTGKLPSVTLPSGQKRYRPEDVESLAQSGDAA